MTNDRLQTIFDLQHQFNARVGKDTDHVQKFPKGKAKWLLQYIRATQQELAELTDCVPWKWWAKYQKYDWQNAKVEVIDIFHFVISMAQTLGMSADDVYEAYLKKNLINNQRQDSGYKVKEENDCKSI